MLTQIRSALQIAKRAFAGCPREAGSSGHPARLPICSRVKAAGLRRPSESVLQFPPELAIPPRAPIPRQDKACCGATEFQVRGGRSSSAVAHTQRQREKYRRHRWCPQASRQMRASNGTSSRPRPARHPSPRVAAVTRHPNRVAIAEGKRTDLFAAEPRGKFAGRNRVIHILK